MTNNEIIKALEACKEADECAVCPLRHEKTCFEQLSTTTLDLINRQKEEIEGLKKQNSISQHLLSEAWHSIEEKDKFCENAKSEAIREFAENAKIAMKTRFSDEIVALNPHFNLVSMLIDDLVKEMTEGSKV